MPRRPRTTTGLPVRPRQYYYRVRGRIDGDVELSCPSCARYSRFKVPWKVWHIQCPECKTHFALGLSVWFIPRHWDLPPWDHVLPNFKPGCVSFRQTDPVEPYKVPVVVGNWVNGAATHTVKGLPPGAALVAMTDLWGRWHGERFRRASA